MIRRRNDTEATERVWAWGPVPRQHASVDEAALVHRLFHLLGQPPEGSTMIDVGAHHGSSCMRFAREGWRVVAFEPDSVNREAFEANLDDDWDIQVDDRAVSDHDEEGRAFFRSDVSTGISGLRAFHESHEFAESVDTTTLRRILTEYGIHHVDFLKTDTEGHDLSVMRGAAWDVDRPDVIVCEFDDAKCGDGTAAEQAGYLHGFGYDVVISEWHPIIRFGVDHDLRGFWLYEPGSSFDGVAWGNMIALKPGLLQLLNDAIDAVVEQRGRSLLASIRASGPAPVLGGPSGRFAPLRLLLRRGLKRNLQSAQRRIWQRISQKHRPRARRLWSRISTLLRWYLSPSGLILLTLLPLMAAGFLVHGLFGVAGTALLGIFLPYRFAREKGIAARTSGAAFNAANKASTSAAATRVALEDRVDALALELDATRNRLATLADRSDRDGQPRPSSDDPDE